jgi:hypothetical protein
MPLAKNVTVIVRHHRLHGLAAVDLLSADDERNVCSFIRHRLQASLELGTLRRSRRVALHRLVDWRRYSAVPIETRECARGDFGRYPRGVELVVV